MGKRAKGTWDHLGSGDLIQPHYSHKLLASSTRRLPAAAASLSAKVKRKLVVWGLMLTDDELSPAVTIIAGTSRPPAAAGVLGEVDLVGGRGRDAASDCISGVVDLLWRMWCLLLALIPTTALITI